MHYFRVLAACAIVSWATLPTASFAQMAMKPTPDEVKTALKATHPSMMQIRQMKPMIDSYKSETVNADDATKKAAAQKLVTNLKSVLSPEQQTEFKQSLMSQMSAAK